MQFEQYPDGAVATGRLLLDFAQQTKGVYRFYHSDVRGDVLHLVGLQMSDEVPFDVTRQSLHLVTEFLLMTFAKQSLPFVVGLEYPFGGMILADSNQSYSFRQAAQHRV